MIIKQKAVKHSLNIALFDRGVQKKQSFAEFHKAKIYFITKIGTHKYEVIEDLPIDKKSTKTLKIISDQKIKFIGDRKKRRADGCVFRVIIGQAKATGEIIKFITNADFLSAAEVTDLYKSRWEIETFFKFIKQEMNFKHLLSRTENGIKVVMYMTMITAILLTVYKKVNKIIGWAVVKIKFLDELETDLMLYWHPETKVAFLNKNSQLINNISSP